MDDDIPTVIHSPTASEIGTYQIIANMNRVDFENRAPPRARDLTAAYWPPSDEELLAMEAARTSPQKIEYAPNFTVAVEKALSPVSRVVTPIEVPAEETHEEDAPAEDAPAELPVPQERREKRKKESSRGRIRENFAEEAQPQWKPYKPPSPPKMESPNVLSAEIDMEKEGMLMELAEMELKGEIRLVRKLTMADNIEEIQFQFDRAQTLINGRHWVATAKSSMEMGSGLIESFVRGPLGIKDVNGFKKNLCSDMSRFDVPLSRWYKKNWRGGTSDPSSDLVKIILGTLIITVVDNKFGSVTSGLASSVMGMMGIKGFSAQKDAVDSETTPPPKMVPPTMPSLKVSPVWANATDLTPPKMAENEELKVMKSDVLKLSSQTEALANGQKAIQAMLEQLLLKSVPAPVSSSENLDTHDDDVSVAATSVAPEMMTTGGTTKKKKKATLLTISRVNGSGN